MKLPPKYEATDFWLDETTNSEAGSSYLFQLRSRIDDLRTEVVHLHACIVLADTGFAGLDHLQAEEQRNIKSAVSARSFPSHDNDLDYKRAINNQIIRIAGHSSADALFQFSEILEFLRDDIGSSDASALVLSPTLDEIRTDFDRLFPKFEQMRHATAHSAEIAAKWQKNSHNGPLSGAIAKKPKGVAIMVSGLFVGRTYHMTRKGEMLRLDVTWDTVEKLERIYCLILKSICVKPELRPKGQISRQP